MLSFDQDELGVEGEFEYVCSLRKCGFSLGTFDSQRIWFGKLGVFPRHTIVDKSCQVLKKC